MSSSRKNMRLHHKPLTVVLTCLFGSMSACTSMESQKTAEAHETPASSQTAAALEPSRMALILQLIGSSGNASEFNKQLESIDRGSRSKISKEAQTVKKDMETMLNTRLSDADLEILLRQGDLLNAQELARKGHLQEARKKTLSILESSLLSLPVYQTALSLFATSTVLLMDSHPPAEVQQSLEALTFDQFRSALCRELCDTPGWSVIAESDRKALTLSDFYNNSLSHKAFRDLGKSRPTWVDALLGSTSPQALAGERTLPSFTRISLLKHLIDSGNWGEAARKVEDLAPSPDSSCSGEYTLGRYVTAQSKRRTQNREGFLAAQTELIHELEKGCTAESLEMTNDAFQVFKLDAKLWLARLLWETGDNPQATRHAQDALLEAQKSGEWDLYLEAAQVLVGRVGFEVSPPIENARALEKMEQVFLQNKHEKGVEWSRYRKGMFLFLSGEFEECRTTFKKFFEEQSEPTLKAGSAYWKGRCSQALKKNSEANSVYKSIGSLEPLGYYDNLAGQMMDVRSGKISTDLLSPFTRPWQEELNSWIRLEPTEPFILFQPFTWMQKNWFSRNPPRQVPLSPQQRSAAFENTLRSSVLLATLLRTAGKFTHFEEYSRYLLSDSSTLTEILKQNSLWLRTTYLQTLNTDDSYNWAQRQIAWLLHITGNYVQAITFVGQLRDRTSLASSENSFLYFIFYPRPYWREISDSAEVCAVDVDLLYAVARQESLFQPAAKSHAGAVGLMQLLPSTAKKVLSRFPQFQNGEDIDLTDPKVNTLAGACYMSDLLKRYNGNLTYAIAAYNAGETVVDKWIKNRTKTQDIPLFIEFLPYAETQKYTQRVLRNYYNMKWVYSSKN